MQDDFVDQDVWGLYREADVVEVVVLFVRAGKLVGRRAFQQKDQELPDSAVIAEHLQQYYATGTFIPDEVVVGVELEDAETLADWLSAARGKRVKLVEPRRGVRARLVELADRNAAASAASRKAGTPTPRRCSTRSRSGSGCRDRRGASSASTSRTSRAPTPSRRW